MNKLYRSLLLTGIVAVGLAGCGDDVTVVDPPAPPPPPDPQVRAVSVTPNNVSVSPGQTIQMTASVTADAGATPTVTWSTSDATRATVSNTGLVTIPASAPTGPVAISATATANGSSASGAATLNVVGTTVTAVTVTPAAANITANQTIQAQAAVTGTNNPAQTVTWSSLAPAVASVNATGLITGLTVGTAVIQACSTVDASKCGTSAITVIPINPALVEVASVTTTLCATPAGAPPCNEIPVVLTNVFGQIQIHLNVDNGDRQLSRVDALIGGVVVASQAFAQTAAQAAPTTAPREVILSTNTRQVRKNGNVFLPVIFNGNNSITANLYVVGESTPVASNAIPVVMNNYDAAIQPGTGGTVFMPTSGVGVTATGATTAAGSTWYGNTATMDVSTQFIAFQKTLPSAHTLSSVGCGSVAGTITGTPTTGIVVNGTLACTGAEGVVTPSVAPGATSYAPATSGPDGTGLVGPGVTAGTGWATVGSAFDVVGDQRWNLINPSLTALAMFNVDNKAPTVNIAGDGSAVVPGFVAYDDLYDQQWISNSYAFTIYNATTNPKGDMRAVDAGVGLASGFPKARRFDQTVPACGTSNLPTQTGADFAETLTSAAPGTDFEIACAYAEDILGNKATSAGSNTFGVDYAKATAPLVRLAGTLDATVTPAIAPSTVASVAATANTTIFGNPGGLGSPFTAFPATDVWGLEGIDDRAGFDQNGAVGAVPAATQTLARLAQTGATSCATFGTLMPTLLSDVYVRTAPLVALDCGLGIGYYTYSGFVTDRAGNKSATIARNYARDDVAAPTVAGFSATNLPYTPGAAGNFAFFAQDDLEVIQGTILLNIPIVTAGVGLRYPLGTVQGLGTKWDATLTGLITNGIATIGYMYFRIDESCSAAGVPYAGCPAPLAKPYITAPVTTVSADYNFNTGLDAGQLPTSAAGAVADVADQLSASTATPAFLPAFFQVPPAAPGLGLPEPWVAAGVQLQGWDLDLTSVAGSALAKQVGSTSVTTPFFEGAQLFRLNLAGEWVLCGNFPAPTSQDNGPDRVWTYTMLVPTTGACTGATFGGGATYRALGRKVGAGLFTPTR